MRTRSLVFSAFLVWSATAFAAPDDPLDQWIAEKTSDISLTQHLQQVRQSFAETASVVTEKASALVVAALGLIGVPYRLGGDSAESGFDCSGFVRTVYEQNTGLVLPRRSNEQAAATMAIDERELEPGDLVFFNTMRRAFSHVGIYMGDGKFIHAPRTGAVVRVEDMGQSYWRTRFNGARRVLLASSDAR